MAENEPLPNQEPEPEFVTHLRAAGRAKVNQWKSLIPDAFWEYRREARREFLLAVKTAVDAAITALEENKPPAPPPPKRRGPRKARVEIE